MTGGEPPLPVHDAEEVRRAADRVLAGDRFAEPPRSLAERALDWLRDLWDRIFPDSDPTAFGEGGGTGGSSIVTVVVLVLALAALVLLVRAGRAGWRRGRRPAPAAVPLDVTVEGRRSAGAWEALAGRLEAEGRWKDALRARFGSLVEQLIDQGLVADVPGRTSGEYRAEVAASVPAAAADFAAAAGLFERAWYGDLPTGPDEARRFAEGAERVLAASGASR